MIEIITIAHDFGVTNRIQKMVLNESIEPFEENNK